MPGSKLADLCDVRIENLRACDTLLYDDCREKWINARPCSKCVCRRHSEDFRRYQHGESVCCTPSEACECDDEATCQINENVCVSYWPKNQREHCKLLAWNAASEEACYDFPPLYHPGSDMCLILGTADRHTGKVTPCCEGGCIEFCFRCPCVLDEVHLLNIDRCWPPTPISVWTSDGVESEHEVVWTGQADDSKGIAQAVKICVDGAKRVKITLDGQGAVCKLVYHTKELVEHECCCRVAEKPPRCIVVDADRCAHDSVDLIDDEGNLELSSLQRAIDHLDDYCKRHRDEAGCTEPYKIVVKKLSEQECCVHVGHKEAIEIVSWEAHTSPASAAWIGRPLFSSDSPSLGGLTLSRVGDDRVKIVGDVTGLDAITAEHGTWFLRSSNRLNQSAMRTGRLEVSGGLDKATLHLDTDLPLDFELTTEQHEKEGSFIAYLGDRPSTLCLRLIVGASERVTLDGLTLNSLHTSSSSAVHVVNTAVLHEAIFDHSNVTAEYATFGHLAANDDDTHPTLLTRHTLLKVVGSMATLWNGLVSQTSVISVRDLCGLGDGGEIDTLTMVLSGSASAPGGRISTAYLMLVDTQMIGPGYTNLIGHPSRHASSVIAVTQGSEVYGDDVFDVVRQQGNVSCGHMYLSVITINETGDAAPVFTYATFSQSSGNLYLVPNLSPSAVAVYAFQCSRSSNVSIFGPEFVGDFPGIAPRIRCGNAGLHSGHSRVEYNGLSLDVGGLSAVPYFDRLWSTQDGASLGFFLCDVEDMGSAGPGLVTSGARVSLEFVTMRNTGRGKEHGIVCTGDHDAGHSASAQLGVFFSEFQATLPESTATKSLIKGDVASTITLGESSTFDNVGTVLLLDRESRGLVSHTFVSSTYQVHDAAFVVDRASRLLLSAGENDNAAFSQTFVSDYDNVVHATRCGHVSAVGDEAGNATTTTTNVAENVKLTRLGTACVEDGAIAPSGQVARSVQPAAAAASRSGRARAGVGALSLEERREFMTRRRRGHCDARA